MEIFSNITFNEYIPDIAPNGLFSKKKPIVFNGEPIKSRELQEILALLEPEITNKLCTYIATDIIRIIPQNQILLKFLQETEIKMLEVFDEFGFNHWDPEIQEYVRSNKSSKHYIFWMTDDNEDYANILYLIHSGQFEDYLNDEEMNTIESISSGKTSIFDIIQGICLGYPVEYIKGYYTTRHDKPNLYECIQGKNVTKAEKNLLYEELNEFLSSDHYKKLSNQFSENYSYALKLIDKIIEMDEFNELVERNRLIIRKCVPDYFVLGE
jgi:hypothetical protein